MGSPVALTVAQKTQLQQAAALDESQGARSLTVHDGKLVVPLTIPRQGVMLVRLRRR